MNFKVGDCLQYTAKDSKKAFLRREPPPEILFAQMILFLWDVVGAIPYRF